METIRSYDHYPLSFYMIAKKIPYSRKDKVKIDCMSRKKQKYQKVSYEDMGFNPEKTHKDVYLIDCWVDTDDDKEPYYSKCRFFTDVSDEGDDPDYEIIGDEEVIMDVHLGRRGWRDKEPIKVRNVASVRDNIRIAIGEPVECSVTYPDVVPPPWREVRCRRPK